MTTVSGTDYLTGDERPLDELCVVERSVGADEASSMFPESSEAFACFAAVFCHKYGIANNGMPPVVLSDESFATVRFYYHETGGSIQRVCKNFAEIP